MSLSRTQAVGGPQAGPGRSWVRLAALGVLLAAGGELAAGIVNASSTTGEFREAIVGLAAGLNVGCLVALVCGATALGISLRSGAWILTACALGFRVFNAFLELVWFDPQGSGPSLGWIALAGLSALLGWGTLATTLLIRRSDGRPILGTAAGIGLWLCVLIWLVFYTCCQGETYGAFDLLVVLSGRSVFLVTLPLLAGFLLSIPGSRARPPPQRVPPGRAFVLIGALGALLTAAALAGALNSLGLEEVLTGKGSFFLGAPLGLGLALFGLGFLGRARRGSKTVNWLAALATWQVPLWIALLAFLERSLFLSQVAAWASVSALGAGGLAVWFGRIGSAGFPRAVGLAFMACASSGAVWVLSGFATPAGQGEVWLPGLVFLTGSLVVFCLGGFHWLAVEDTIAS